MLVGLEFFFLCFKFNWFCLFKITCMFLSNDYCWGVCFGLLYMGEFYVIGSIESQKLLHVTLPIFFSFPDDFGSLTHLFVCWFVIHPFFGGTLINFNLVCFYLQSVALLVVFNLYYFLSCASYLLLRDVKWMQLLQFLHCNYFFFGLKELLPNHELLLSLELAESLSNQE